MCGDGIANINDSFQVEALLKSKRGASLQTWHPLLIVDTSGAMYESKNLNLIVYLTKVRFNDQWTLIRLFTETNTTTDVHKSPFGLIR